MTHEYTITKEDHLWTTEEKMKFCGYGEWVEEPDEVYFEYRGYEGVICRTLLKEPYAKEEAWFGGHLCGFVKIPNSHPFFNQKDLIEDLNSSRCISSYVSIDEYDQEFLIGFDCAHSGDLVPTTEHMKKHRQDGFPEIPRIPLPESLKNHSWFKPVYRNIEYCIEECIMIIDQLVHFNQVLQ